MRRRHTFIFTVGLLALSLLVPSAASAGSAYTYVIVNNYCDGDEPNITVRLRKPAGYYPDRFQIVAQGQHKNLGGTRWSNEGSSSTFNKNIPFQYARYSWTKSVYWNPPDGQWHRIKLRLRVIDNGSVVATETVNSVAC